MTQPQNTIGRKGSSWPWVRLLAAAWILFFFVRYMEDVLPTSFWINTETVIVNDAEFGQDPNMEVTREVSRPFSARFVVTARKQLPGTDIFVFFCNYSSRAEYDYRPSSHLPDDLTLGWWFEYSSCWEQIIQNPGTYKVDTLRKIRLSTGRTRPARAPTSNSFRIRVPT